MNRAIFIPIFFFLSVVVLGVFALPNYYLYQNLESKIKIQKLQIIQGEQYFKNLRSAYQLFQTHPENIEKIKGAIPRTPSLPSLFNYLQQSAAQSGMVLKNIGMSRSTREKTFSNKKIRRFTLTLGLRGDYEGLKKFIGLLERSSRLMSIRSLNLGDYKNGSFDIKISVDSYYF